MINALEGRAAFFRTSTRREGEELSQTASSESRDREMVVLSTCHGTNAPCHQADMILYVESKILEVFLVRILEIHYCSV